MSLDRHAHRLLRMLAMAPPSPTVRDVAERRRGLEQLRAIAEAEPEPGLEVQDISLPGPGGALDARLYQTENQDQSGPLLLYFHGGGWVAGGLETHDGVCRRLALASACAVLSLDYRLAPEHPFPAAIEDGLAAFAWVVANAEALGADPDQIGLAGDSAGAGIAAAVAQTLAQSAGRQPKLLLLICPILDVSRESPSRREFAEGYFLDRDTLLADLADYAPSPTDLTDPRLSPLLAERLDALPPVLVHTAQFDPFRDEGQAFAGRLTQAGASVRHTEHGGMIHYFYALTRAIPHGATVMTQIGREVREILER
ncbi:MAG: alpha/beta hydrolase [Caulobacteraceae bacterium]|nr:alpha/beta hydrolase [Caulobacteraceae bacterium]